MASEQHRYFGGRQPDYCKPRTEPLEVLVLGLSRTGTTSMLEAMKILGYGTMYNSREMWTRDHNNLLAAAADAKFIGMGRPFTLEQFESAWGEYRCVSGEPAIMFAEELISLYPKAKVILTIRDNEDTWFHSISETMWLNYCNRFQIILDYTHPTFRKVRQFRSRFWRYIFWDDFPAHGRRIYREHNAMVQRLVPKDRLLVFNAKEGWTPLCQFLDMPIPEIPFPHVFKAPEYRTLFSSARRSAYAELVTKFLKVTLPVVVTGILVWKRASLMSHLRIFKSR